MSQQNRELMLLQNLVQAVEDNNAEVFSDHLFNYNQVNVLDPWKTELLLRIKNGMIICRDFGGLRADFRRAGLTQQAPVDVQTGEIDLS